MRTIRTVMVDVCSVIVMVAICLYPGRMHAQEQARGEFSLSQQVHWAGSILPAGDYSYSVRSASERMMVRVLRKGGNFSGLFLPLTFSQSVLSGPNQMRLKRIGRDMFVSSLHLQALETDLTFYNVGAASEDPSIDLVSAPTAPSRSADTSRFTIFNPKHENVSLTKAQRLYMTACEAVERELNSSTTIRPRLVVNLGSTQNELIFPDSHSAQVRLKKWDDYRFAEAIVELSLYKLVSYEERIRITNLAVDKAEATVNLCELKDCMN